MARNDSKTSIKATLRNFKKSYNGKGFAVDDDDFYYRVSKIKRNKVKRKRDE